MTATSVLPQPKEACHRHVLPIRTEAHLRQWVWDAFGVSFPTQAVCPGHVAPWQVFCDAYFARHPLMILKGSRALAGKSYLLATLGLVEAITLGCSVNLLGGSGEQAKRVHDYMGQHWRFRRAPRSLLASDPAKRETQLTSGAKVQALMASQASVRGPHVPRLRIDEAEDATIDLIEAALGQPMGMGGVAAQTLISSTHHIPNGTMTELLRRAAEKRWPVMEFCFRETMHPHGWLDPSEVELKRHTMTASQFSVECEMQQPSAEGRAILPEAVERAFPDATMLEVERIELEPPVPGATYAHGADWARSVDWTVIPTLRTDVNPLRVVAYERMQRLPWPVMLSAFDARLSRYGGPACHDGTGLGDVVAGHLTEAAEPIILSGRIRTDLLSEYIAALERGEIVAPRIRALYDAHRYASTGDVYGPGHLPDDICAMALAYRATKSMRQRGDTGLSLGQSTLPDEPKTYRGAVEMHNGVPVTEHAQAGCMRCQGM